MAKRAKQGQVGIRELRQNLSAHLARVKKGQRLEVTEHGRPVALLVPLPKEASGLERMVAEGRAAAPTGDLPSLGPSPPLPPGRRRAWPGSIHGPGGFKSLAGVGWGRCERLVLPGSRRRLPRLQPRRRQPRP